MGSAKGSVEQIIAIVLKEGTTTERVEAILSDAGCTLGAHFRNLHACSALVPLPLPVDDALESIRDHDEVISAELALTCELILPPELDENTQ